MMTVKNYDLKDFDIRIVKKDDELCLYKSHNHIINDNLCYGLIKTNPEIDVINNPILLSDLFSMKFKEKQGLKVGLHDLTENYPIFYKYHMKNTFYILDDPFYYNEPAVVEILKEKNTDIYSFIVDDFMVFTVGKDADYAKYIADKFAEELNKKHLGVMKYNLNTRELEPINNKEMVYDAMLEKEIEV